MSRIQILPPSLSCLTISAVEHLLTHPSWCLPLSEDTSMSECVCHNDSQHHWSSRILSLLAILALALTWHHESHVFSSIQKGQQSLAAYSRTGESNTQPWIRRGCKIPYQRSACSTYTSEWCGHLLARSTTRDILDQTRLRTASVSPSWWIAHV